MKQRKSHRITNVIRVNPLHNVKNKFTASHQKIDIEIFITVAQTDIATQKPGFNRCLTHSFYFLKNSSRRSMPRE